MYDEEGQVCRVDDPFAPAPPVPNQSLAPPPIVQGLPPGPWAPGYNPAAAGPFLDLYGPPAPAGPTHKNLNDDPALGSLRAALDDPSLTTAARAAMMLDYRNKNLALVDFSAMSKMQKNDPSMPLYGSGDKKGLQHALYA